MVAGRVANKSTTFRAYCVTEYFTKPLNECGPLERCMELDLDMRLGNYKVQSAHVLVPWIILR
jgi:hypothetical protein